ncbi:TMEM175 family protein [Bacteroidota bacterium]
MKNTLEVPSTRIEAFSDGVIAILLTLMVFDLKPSGLSNTETLLATLPDLLPRLICYVLSFLVIAIMWVNHHQLFHQIKYSSRGLLWHSIHLLFWMSLIPFSTGMMGSAPLFWASSFVYGFVFGMCALSFTFLRNFVLKHDLLHAHIEQKKHLRIRNKNRFAFAIYFLAAMVSPLSVWLSFVGFTLVPAMYFIPERIEHNQNQNGL